MKPTQKREKGILPLAGRIEAWARLQVMSGALTQGERLPTADAMAQRFDANVNTVRAALSRLEADGLIDIRHGKGAFVSASLDPVRSAAVRDFLSDTIVRGDALDLRPEEIATLLWAEGDAGSKGRQFWLVDNDHPYRSMFVEYLEKALKAKVRVLDYDTLNSEDGRTVTFAEHDVVMTRFRFLGELRARFSDSGAAFFPLRTQLNANGMFELATYPDSSRVGCICINDALARSLGQAILRHDMMFEQDFASLDDPAGIQALCERSDVIATSCAGLAGLKEIYGEYGLPKPTVLLVYEIDPESLAMIVARLEGPGKTTRQSDADTLASWTRAQAGAAPSMPPVRFRAGKK